MDWGLFAAFVVAAVAIQVLPGPGMLFVITAGMTGGPRAGIVAALGAASSMAVHTTAVALGLAALFAAAPTAMLVVRLAGAAYLVWLAIQAFRSRGEAHPPETRGEPEYRRVYLRAALNNLLNPKIIVFNLVFLPEFVNRGLGDPQAQLWVLGGTLLAIGLVVDVLAGALAGLAGRWLRRGRMLQKVAGTVYAALAAQLLLNR